jgi:NTP pyrophosphatase (non-canonical NTP hydrolase)
MIGCKFNKGDRVELVEDYGTRKKGEQGVVRNTHYGCDSYLVEVRMDTATKAGSVTMECYERRLKAAPAKLVFDQSVFAPQPGKPLPDAIYLVSQAADRIFPRRSYDTILKSLMEEMGELSTEIAIAQGTKKRAASVDGVKGEAVDVFVVAVDMLRQAWGDKLHTTEFTDAVAAKLAKWEGK